MSRIIYSSTPPTPDGLSEADLRLLRNELAEDTVQALIRVAEDAPSISETAYTEYDIRDLGPGRNVMTGIEETDTDALLDAVSLITSSSTSTDSQPGVVTFPRGTLLLGETLSIYGGASTAFSWLARNGRSRGPDGTQIKWTGGVANSPMLHLYGLNATLFDNICFNADSKARFCVWAETNQRNGGAGSSGVTWRDCTFTSPGERGVGMICGDELRKTLTVSSVTGSFTPGEYVLDNYDDSIGTVVSYTAGSLAVKEIIGGGFTTVGGTLTGLTSGATATTDVATVNPSYQGNMQFSEGLWERCYFQGSGSVNGWAGWATFGANNNKDYSLTHPAFDQFRYGIDAGYGSGYLNVIAPTGGNMGQGTKGAICRAGGPDLTWKNGNFEGFTGYVFNLSNVKADIEGGEYYGTPADDVAIKCAGAVNIKTVSLGTALNPAKIVHAGGTLNLDAVNWREDFTGYIPIEDTSGNPLGGQGSADYTRGVDSGITARGCIANVNAGLAGQRLLPDLLAKPLSPLRNQLLDNGVTGITVGQRGILSCSVEKRTIGYAKVAAGAAVTFALSKPKAVVRGVVINVSTRFLGGLLSAVTMSVGHSTGATAYLAAKDVFTATTQFSGFAYVLAPWAGDSIIATFAPTGAAISALTQGSVDIYILYEVLA